MVGSLPDITGSVTVMSECSNCSGAALTPQDFENYGTTSQEVASATSYIMSPNVGADGSSPNAQVPSAT